MSEPFNFILMFIGPYSLIHFGSKIIALVVVSAIEAFTKERR